MEDMVKQVPAPSRSPEEQLRQLRFLHRVARLATTARTWDELLETIVDETRDALHADVSSLYLLDRDGSHLTLAATNGLDRHQIGRARVPFGEGVTGRVAASQEAMIVADVRQDQRFLWVRGIDQRRYVASMLSVPLSWHAEIVGVLNVQTEAHRDFDPEDAAQLSAIADLLAGVVQKGRLQRDAEAQVIALQRLDVARTELIAMVTHELRTPLAVVRAYADLLADDPPLDGRPSRDPERRAQREEWYQGTLSQIDRLDRLVDSILASIRPSTEGPVEVVPIDVGALLEELVVELKPLLRQHRIERHVEVRRHALADPPRLRQIIEHLVENAVKYAPPETTITVDVTLVEGIVRLGVGDEGPGIPPEWRERIFEPYARRDTHTARGSGIGLYAARRLAEAMGARLWCEPAPGNGARFVLALPAAVAV
jgi:signal transduction histidine kinase